MCVPIPPRGVITPDIRYSDVGIIIPESAVSYIWRYNTARWYFSIHCIFALTDVMLMAYPVIRIRIDRTTIIIT
jgi:hypothetical protein